MTLKYESQHVLELELGPARDIHSPPARAAQKWTDEEHDSGSDLKKRDAMPM